MDINQKEEVSPDIFATIPKQDTATFVVPLYGFFRDELNPGLTPEVLQTALFRLRSFFHATYTVFVAERGRLDEKVNVMLDARSKAMNVMGVEVEKDASLGMYFDEGIRYALENTQSQFIICATPWEMIGKDSVDILMERINRIDVQVCSGTDLRLQGISADAFDGWAPAPAKEFYGFELGLWGMTRPIAEMISIDHNYRTKKYLELDLGQALKSKGFNVISSESIPVWSFEVDWSRMEGEESEDIDRAYFQKKWGYLPTN